MLCHGEPVSGKNTWLVPILEVLDEEKAWTNQNRSTDEGSCSGMEHIRFHCVECAVIILLTHAGEVNAWGWVKAENLAVFPPNPKM